MLNEDEQSLKYYWAYLHYSMYNQVDDQDLYTTTNSPPLMVYSLQDLISYW